jgi:hypothetical protein
MRLSLFYLLYTLMPYFVIDISLTWKFILIIANLIFCLFFGHFGCLVAIETFAIWTWGLVCAIRNPSSILSIIYFVLYLLFILYSLFANNQKRY